MKRSLFVVLLLVLALMSIGTLMTSAQATTVQCGDIVEGEFRKSESSVQFTITLAPGDVLEVSARRFGDYLLFYDWYSNVHTGILAPSGSVVTRLRGDSSSYSSFTMKTGVLGERGEYTIKLTNMQATGSFTLEIGCTLRDGTVIKPGDVSPTDDSASANETRPTPEPAFPVGAIQGTGGVNSSTEASSSPFTGFGFPGIGAVDFSAGIPFPLALGESHKGAVGSDITLYTYEASEGEAATLSISRVNGNVSIGVTVINQADNSIVFLGGMPTSNNLSVELTFPTSGTYAIGVFRLDTATLAGTSGVVEISLQ